MQIAASNHVTDAGRYARSLDISRRVNWDIDDDVIRGRRFDFSKKFLPDGLSLVARMESLSDIEKRLMSQIQGRTYANIFGLVERFINAKILDVSRDHSLGDQTALEALIHFSQEELKHQELFRRIEAMVAEGMPEGYRFLPDPDDVAEAVLSKSTWAVLGLTCHIELFTQAHYRQSIRSDSELSDLYKDVFLYHWREESQHAVLDELEWTREDAKLSDTERDRAVDDLIELVGAVDGILQIQSVADTAYFASICERTVGDAEQQDLEERTLAAYRWQYIVSGVQEPRFQAILGSLINEEQMERITTALGTLM